jgi:hypothetical protein
MIGMKINSLFFDQPAVVRTTDRATRRVFSRFGAFVRRSARSSIRRRKRTSSPGQPPTSRTGLLKRFIFFGFDPTKRSVVIGPARLNGSGRGDAPSLLEHGGTTTLRRRGQRHRVHFRGRPYMGPAFDKEQPKLPAMWRDSVRR